MGPLVARVSAAIWPGSQSRHQQGSLGGARQATHHYAAIIYASHDGGSCAGGLGERHAARMQRGVAVVVGEVEARHGGCCCVEGSDNGRAIDFGLAAAPRCLGRTVCGVGELKTSSTLGIDG